MAEPVREISSGAKGERPRAERASAQSKQSRPAPTSARSGSGGSSRGGQPPRVHTAGKSTRRPSTVKAGTGARVLAPLALIIAALACFVVLTSQEGGGASTAPVSSQSASDDGESGTASTDSASGGPTRSVYVVKEGDSFSAIAVKFDVDAEVLQELNPDVDPRALQPGQKLKLKE